MLEKRIQRFQNILHKNGMIYNKGIVKNDIDIDKYDRREISGIIRYFAGTHDLDDLEYLPADFTVRDMEETFGFKEEYGERSFINSHFHFGINDETQAVDVVGYDVMIRGMMRKLQAGDPKSVQGELFVVRKGDKIVILKNDVEIYEYDMMNGVDFRDRDIVRGDLVVEEENSLIRVKLVFSSIFGSYDGDADEIEINGAEVILLIDFK